MWMRKIPRNEQRIKLYQKMVWEEKVKSFVPPSYRLLVLAKPTNLSIFYGNDPWEKGE